MGPNATPASGGAGMEGYGNTGSGQTGISSMGGDGGSGGGSGSGLSGPTPAAAMRAGLPVKGMTVASAQNLGLPTSVGSPQGFQGYGSTVGSGGTWRYRWLWHGWRDEYRSWCGRNGRLWLEGYWRQWPGWYLSKLGPARGGSYGGVSTPGVSTTTTSRTFSTPMVSA